MRLHFVIVWAGDMTDILESTDYMIDQARIDAELSRRYRWFCEIGWKEPTLNDPVVINGKATPNDIDRLIICGMKR